MLYLCLWAVLASLNSEIHAAVLPAKSNFFVYPLETPLDTGYQAYPLNLCVPYNITLSGTTLKSKYATFTCNAEKNKVTFTSFTDADCTIDGGLQEEFSNTGLTPGSLYSFECGGIDSYSEFVVTTVVEGASTPLIVNDQTCCLEPSRLPTLSQIVASFSAVNVCVPQPPRDGKQISNLHVCSDRITVNQRYEGATCSGPSEVSSAFRIDYCQFSSTVDILGFLRGSVYLQQKSCFVGGNKITEAASCTGTGNPSMAPSQPPTLEPTMAPTKYPPSQFFIDDFTTVQPLGSQATPQAFPIGLCMPITVTVKVDNPLVPELTYAKYECSSDGNTVTKTTYGSDKTCGTAVGTPVVYSDSTIAAGEKLSFNCDGSSNYVNIAGCPDVGKATPGANTPDAEESCCKPTTNMCTPNYQAVDVCVKTATEWKKVTCEGDRTQTAYYSQAGCPESSRKPSRKGDFARSDLCYLARTELTIDVYLQMQQCVIKGSAVSGQTSCDGTFAPTAAPTAMLVPSPDPTSPAEVNESGNSASPGAFPHLACLAICFFLALTNAVIYA